MFYFNSVIIMGNITRDPELKYTQSGVPVCSFDLAMNKPGKKVDGEERKSKPIFVKITAWNKTAELCAEYLKKGSPVLIDGELKMDEWEKDGVKRSRLEVIANKVQFLPKPGKTEGESEQGADSQEEPNPEEHSEES